MDAGLLQPRPSAKSVRNAARIGPVPEADDEVRNRPDAARHGITLLPNDKSAGRPDGIDGFALERSDWKRV